MEVMKRGWSLIILVLLVLMPGLLQAQLLGGFFSQKKEQRKLLVQQIAALRVYGNYLKQGYGIVKDGAGLIGDLKKGEFTLHKDYFSSLYGVNPAISGSGKVSAIKALAALMANLRSEMISLAADRQAITAAEYNSLKTTLNGLASELSQALDDLLLVTSPGMAQFSDQGRIRIIDNVYGRVRGYYGQHIRLAALLQNLVSARKQEKRDREVSKQIQGLQ